MKGLVTNKEVDSNLHKLIMIVEWKNSKAKIIEIIGWENICTKYVSQGRTANIIKLLIQIYSKCIKILVDNKTGD